MITSIVSERPDALGIVGEIAERLTELEELRGGLAGDTVVRLGELYRLSPWGFKIVTELLRGNSDAAVDSFNAQASRRGLTKQAIFCEYESQLELIEAAFPEVSAAIREVRRAALSHGERVSADEVTLRGCSRDDDLTYHH